MKWMLLSRSSVSDRELDPFPSSGQWRCKEASQTDQVITGHGQQKLKSHAQTPSQFGLAKRPHGLAPTERFLDPFANALADRITVMSSGTTINRRATGSIEVLCDMRGDFALTQCGNKIGGVIGPIRAERLGLFLRFQQGHSGIALRIAVGLINRGIDH